jgi:hypothetical protein
VHNLRRRLTSWPPVGMRETKLRQDCVVADARGFPSERGGKAPARRRSRSECPPVAATQDRPHFRTVLQIATRGPDDLYIEAIRRAFEEVCGALVELNFPAFLPHAVHPFLLFERVLAPWIPWLCRGGSKSLTFTAVVSRRSTRPRAGRHTGQIFDVRTKKVRTETEGARYSGRHPRIQQIDKLRGKSCDL